MDARLDRRSLQQESWAHETECARADLDAFTYVVSHDLKEPLFGIETYATFLLEDYGARLDEPGRQLITTLLDLAAHQRRMIDAVHRYSTIGRTPVSFEDTDVNGLVADVLGSLRTELATLNVEIRIPHPLPPVRCDPALVRHAWRNLILNAATFNDKPTKWVELGCTPAADGSLHPTFYVRDNGIGIADRDRCSIFSMFTRLDRRTARAHGVGAGLTIAQRAIERHGGTIRVESRVGEGSTLYFTVGAPPLS